LQEKKVNLQVVEIDGESVSYLKQHFPLLKEKIHEEDFLTASPEAWFDGEFNIVGNFPYNISSQILFRTLELRHKVPLLVGMFQKEVAERICASHGNKTYGILSVLTQAYYETQLLFPVSETVFFPPPKVQSAVIMLVRRKVPIITQDDALFFRIVKMAFNQRRKTMRNALSAILTPEIRHLPVFDLRAEQLSVSEFAALKELLKNME
jgi:16S rRNA (adenine1518-N6/adenine1519-N6)-dimethyltransferase